jgi:hypothetical protein
LVAISPGQISARFLQGWYVLIMYRVVTTVYTSYTLDAYINIYDSPASYWHTYASTVARMLLTKIKGRHLALRARNALLACAG